MTKNEQIRLTNWLFKVLQQAGEARSVSRTCRHHGISRNTFYKWDVRDAEYRRVTG
jgi:transposase-like protein